MSDHAFSSTMADPRIGMVIQDRYRIIRRLGEGGMGAVYEGEHVMIKRRVAIKCLHARHATHAEIVARFHNEALAATSIGHQNIIEVTDMGRFDDGSVYMVLEYLDGRDLAKAVEMDGPFEVGRMVHVVSQVCDALQAAHDKGIIHRDLKPENVFLVRRGDDPDFVKVLDFGIAKFKEGAGKNMTRTGTTMGTPYYMAPEQAKAVKELDHRADIYSLGVIIFNALTRQHPFDDDSYPMLVVKICTEPPPPLRQYRPDVTEELERIVERMLSKEPEERFASCAEVKAALAPFRAVHSAPVVSESAIPTRDIPATGLRSGIRPSEGNRDGSTRPAGSYDPKSVAPAVAAAAPGAISDPQLTRRGSGLLWVGLALAVLGVGGAAAAWALGVFGGGAPSTDDARETPVAPVGPGAETEPTVEPTAEPAPAVPAATVRVQIETEPRAAELFLDGRRIANPFDADLPQNDDAHRLEARLDGYRTVVQDLSLSFPQRVRLTLERGSGVDDRRRPAARRAADAPETPQPAERPPREQREPAPTASAMQASEPATTPAREEPSPATTVEIDPATPPLKRVRFR